MSFRTPTSVGPAVGSSHTRPPRRRAGCVPAPHRELWLDARATPATGPHGPATFRRSPLPPPCSRAALDRGRRPPARLPRHSPSPCVPFRAKPTADQPRCVVLPLSLRTQRPSLPLHQPENPGPRASGHLKPSLVISLCDALRTVSATNLTKITFLPLNFLDFEHVLYWWTLRPIWRVRSPEWQRR